MLNWIGGVLGISERCEKRYGVDPIYFRVKQRSGSEKMISTTNANRTGWNKHKQGGTNRVMFRQSARSLPELRYTCDRWLSAWQIRH